MSDRPSPKLIKEFELQYWSWVKDPVDKNTLIAAGGFIKDRNGNNMLAKVTGENFTEDEVEQAIRSTLESAEDSSNHITCDEDL